MGSSMMGESASLLELFAANAALETSFPRMQARVLDQVMLSFERIRTHLRTESWSE